MTTTEETRLRNRRRSQRAQSRSYVKVQCRKGSYGLGKNLAVKVLDISDNGIRLVVTDPIPEKSEVEIIITGYGVTGVIKRLGYVRWQLVLESGQHCIGVELQKCINYRDWQCLIALK